MKSLAYNKRAVFDYKILEKFEAGLVLLGTEVKSVRAGNMKLRGAFVTMHGDEAFLTNATIPPWQPANTPESYDPERPRRLLLKKEELKQLLGTRRAGGLTIIPIRVYNKGPHLKLEIALARGKKQHDKKQQKKERDIQRDVDRVLRGKE
ncbi:MAG: SsrA-binding protein SmpB [Candidatus Andersenbacteria bacterium]